MADNVPASMIDARLADLREANEVFRKSSRDQGWNIQRNDREIRWLADLRSVLVAARCNGADDLEHLDGMLDDRERG